MIWACACGARFTADYESWDCTKCGAVYFEGDTAGDYSATWQAQRPMRLWGHEWAAVAFMAAACRFASYWSDSDGPPITEDTIRRWTMETCARP